MKLGMLWLDGTNVEEVDLQVILLADLQQEQDAESKNTLGSAGGKVITNTYLPINFYILLSYKLLSSPGEYKYHLDNLTTGTHFTDC